MDHKEELWRDVKDYEGIYQVSNLGNVRRLAYVKTMCNQFDCWLQDMPEYVFTPGLDTRGYPQVSLTIGKRRVARVHRLVAEAFLEAPSQELQTECELAGFPCVLVNHKDGNKVNNNIANLEWCSPKYNVDHAMVVIGINHKKGEDCHSNKLSREEAVEVYTLAHQSAQSQESIAEVYGIKQITVSNIKTGRAWAWATGHKRTPRSNKKRVCRSIAEDTNL